MKTSWVIPQGWVAEWKQVSRLPGDLAGGIGRFEEQKEETNWKNARKSKLWKMLFWESRMNSAYFRKGFLCV